MPCHMQSQLASRALGPFHKDPQVAARLVSALSANWAGIRRALQAAVAMSATAQVCTCSAAADLTCFQDVQCQPADQASRRILG